MFVCLFVIRKDDFVGMGLMEMMMMAVSSGWVEMEVEV